MKNIKNFPAALVVIATFGAVAFLVVNGHPIFASICLLCGYDFVGMVKNEDKGDTQ